MPNNSWEFWITGWLFEPSIVLGLAVLYAGYLFATGRRRNRFKGNRPLTSGQFGAFTAGIIVLIIALLSPLDPLGDRYLFTAHMTQHMLLTLVAPPLLLLGTPGWLFEPLRSSRRLMEMLRRLANPYIAFLSFNMVFALWHAPSLYNAALASEPLHVLEHLTFIGTALLTMLPIMSPTPLLPRLAPPVQVFYLFLQSLFPTALGAIIAFDSTPLYSFYVQAPRIWGLSVMEDQLYAGLIMWIGGALFWLFALTIVFFKWFNREEPIEGQGFI
jgi:cytochrome c oxidase assembly factor CtaG